MSQSFYVSQDGTKWAVVEMTQGSDVSVHPPATLRGTVWQPELYYKGDPSGVISNLNWTYKQSELAEMFGVTQQTISRWINGTAKVVLSEVGWRLLARLCWLERPAVPVNHRSISHLRSDDGSPE